MRTPGSFGASMGCQAATARRVCVCEHEWQQPSSKARAEVWLRCCRDPATGLYTQCVLAWLASQPAHWLPVHAHHCPTRLACATGRRQARAARQGPPAAGRAAEGGGGHPAQQRRGRTRGVFGRSWLVCTLPTHHATQGPDTAAPPTPATHNPQLHQTTTDRQARARMAAARDTHAGSAARGRAQAARTAAACAPAAALPARPPRSAACARAAAHHAEARAR
jgi:hypothetical protein